MKMYLKTILTLLVCNLIIGKSNAQNGWPSIPFYDHIGLKSGETFKRAIFVASASYLIAELSSKEPHKNYYQMRVAVLSSEEYTVVSESFGIEKRVRPWFALGAEFLNQQWFHEGFGGTGVGIVGFWRWYVFGKKRISPLFEFAPGTYYAMRKFPEGGSNFTFHLNTSLGVEYTLKSNDKLRLTYTQLHQSNNDLFSENPGIDLTGFTLTYLWRWVDQSEGQ